MCKYARIYMCIYTDVVEYIYICINDYYSKNVMKKYKKTLRHA